MSDVVNLFDRKKELEAEKPRPTVFTHNNEGFLLPPGATASMSGQEKTSYPNSHMHGPAVCMLCDHTCDVTTPVGAFPIECPACKHKYMLYRLPPAPSKLWVCLCGCDQWYLTPDLPQCIACGNKTVDWANS